MCRKIVSEPPKKLDVTNPPKKLDYSRINLVSHLSKAGFSNGVLKTNQDNYIVKLNLNNKKDRSLFAICDGHGVQGHLVSTFVKNTIIKKMESTLEKDFEADNEEFVKNCLSLVFL